MNWFLPLILFSSFSLRTPNVQPNPNDYEFSFGVERKDQLYLNRQWERELGKEYVDEEYWTAYQYGWFKIKNRYVDKDSKDIRYNQFELKAAKDIYSVGYALRYDDTYNHRMIFGIEHDMRFNFFITSGQLTVRSETTTDFDIFDYSLYVKAKFGLMRNVDAYLLFQDEKVGKIEYLQVKLGVELELPSIMR